MYNHTSVWLLKQYRRAETVDAVESVNQNDQVRWQWIVPHQPPIHVPATSYLVGSVQNAETKPVGGAYIPKAPKCYTDENREVYFYVADYSLELPAFVRRWTHPNVTQVEIQISVRLQLSSGIFTRIPGFIVDASKAVTSEIVTRAALQRVGSEYRGNVVINGILKALATQKPILNLSWNWASDEYPTSGYPMTLIYGVQVNCSTNLVEVQPTTAVLSIPAEDENEEPHDWAIV